MKASLSPLSILDFAITSMEFKTIVPENPDVDVNACFSSYIIEIDFGIYMEELIHVYISTKVNYGEEKYPGYSFFAEVGCIFEYNEKIELTKAQKADLEGYSTIYIALNSMRGLISNFTANAPFGRYILPSIDLNDLIAQKRTSLAGSKKVKIKKTNTGRKIKKNSTKKS